MNSSIARLTKSDLGKGARETAMGIVTKMEFRLETWASSSMRQVLYKGLVRLKRLLPETDLTCFEGRRDKLSPGGLQYEMVHTQTLAKEVKIKVFYDKILQITRVIYK